MRAVSIDRIRRTGLGWGIAAVFAVAAYGCAAMASNPAPAPQRSAQAPQSGHASNASGDSRATPSPMASGSGGSGSAPPGWPWRGVTLINPGATPKDIDMLKSQLGINSVHLYLHVLQVARAKKLSAVDAWNESMTWLDSMLAECRKDGVVAVVSLKSIPRPDGGFYNQNTSEFWNSSEAISQAYKQVTALAKHLRGYGSEFGAYDILNEPVMRTSSGARVPPNWDEVQKKIVEIIRAQDPDRWIAVKPGPWGGVPGYKNWSPLPYPKLIYSVHIYVPHKYTHQGIGNRPVGMSYPSKVGRRSFDKQALERYMDPLVRFQDRYNVPIYVGEFSAVRWAPGSSQYIEDLASIFDSNGWGWAYFSLGGFNGWDPRYDSTYTPTKTLEAGHEVGTKSQRWQALESVFSQGG